MARLEFADRLDAVDASAMAQGVDIAHEGFDRLTVMVTSGRRTVSSQTYRRVSGRLPKVVRHRPPLQRPANRRVFFAGRPPHFEIEY